MINYMIEICSMSGETTSHSMMKVFIVALIR